MRKTLSIIMALVFVVTAGISSLALVLDTAENFVPAVEKEARLLEDALTYASAKEGQYVTLGEGTWTISDDGGTGAVVGGNILTASGYSGIVTVTNGETEKKVHLVGGTKWKPGLNFLTGTTDVIDITHENGSFVVGENADIRDVDNQTAAEKNPVGQFETNYGYHWFPIEEMSFDRNILIKFDFAGASNTTRLVVNGGNEGKFWYDFGSNSGNRAIWDSYKYDGKAGSNATSNYSSLNKLGFVICWSGYVEGYFDNYAFIPFYKITYTGIGDEYFLYDENGDIATFYTIDTSKTVSEEGKTFLGWSTEKNTTEVMTSVALENADVVLYPVWEIEGTTDYELSVSGETEIVLSAEDKIYAYTAGFSADVPDNTVVWSVNDTSIAKIDANGVLTPVKAGKVTVSAKANYYPYKTASLEVEIAEPAEVEYVTVTFEGNITNAPAPVTLIKGQTLKISDYMSATPLLSGKRFNGWLLDGKPVSEDFAVESDITLTALVNDDYNFAVAANHSDWDYNVGPESMVDNALYCAYDHASNTDVYITNNSLNVSAAKYTAMEYYIDKNYKIGGEDAVLSLGDTFEGTFFGRTGEGAHWQRQVRGEVTGITDDGKYAIVTFNMSSNAYWNGNIEYIRFDFIGNAAYEFAVRYIRFVGDADAKVIYASAKEGQTLGLGSGNWTLKDNGNSEATLSGNVLSAKGYSGVVTLNDGLYDVTVYLLGGNKWKPGLNILTGTTEPADINHANGKYIVGENPDIRDVNNETSSVQNPVAQYENNYGYHFFPVDEISFDRRILIKFDFSGASNTTRFIVNNKNEGNFYYDFGSLNNHGSWTTYKYDGVASTNATNNYESINKLGIVLCWSSYVEAYLDNYVFVPFYKVTYTGIGDEYFLYDAAGNIATEYTVDTTKTIASVDGREFIGWSTTENATVAMTSVVLANEDVVLYPVWGEDNRPSSLDVVSMRTTLPQGIRIASFVKTDIRNLADEYGFVVSRADLLEEGYVDLTVDADVTTVVAKAYEKGKTDIIYLNAMGSADTAKAMFGDAALDTLGVYFTGVYVGIPETADAYKTVLVARPYVKVGERYFYGAPIAKSVYDAATELKATYEKDGKEVPEYITKVLEIAG